MPTEAPMSAQPSQAGTGEFTGATPVLEVTIEELFREVDAGAEARLKATVAILQVHHYYYRPNAS